MRAGYKVQLIDSTITPNFKKRVLEAVRDALKQAIGDAPAIATEGRADADPVDTNATPEGREHNRRIDIVLRQLP